MRLLRSSLTSALGIAILSACVYVPVVDENAAASSSCKTFTKEMSLDVIEVKGYDFQCRNDDCIVGVLTTAAVVSAGSVIISGSIVLTGNTVHWLEYQGTCSDGYLGKTKRLFLETFSKQKPATTSEVHR